MPRTDEAQWWFEAVYAAVQEVPVGRVTTYGHIALLLGQPQRSRQVGVCLKHLPRAPSGRRADDGDDEAGDDDDDDSDSRPPIYHFGNVPWQRIINSKGQISPRGPDGAARQAAALRGENVSVRRGALGELTVDLAAYGWFPDMLPSEGGPGHGQGPGGQAADDDEDDQEENEEDDEEEEEEEKDDDDDDDDDATDHAQGRTAGRR